MNQATYPELKKPRRRLLEEPEGTHEEFQPILDDDVHRFNGHLKFAHGENNHNYSGLGEEEMPYIDHGEEDPSMFVDDYTSVQRHDFYYGHSRHRTHEGYMDDHIPYFGGGGAEELDLVHLDPHVLGSPALVDVNGDGHLDVIMTVSYYFDKSEYAGRELDYDPSMYVAGGVVCWDLKNQNWAWSVHLDLTTDKTQFKALIYSSPTVAVITTIYTPPSPSKFS